MRKERDDTLELVEAALGRIRDLEDSAEASRRSAQERITNLQHDCEELRFEVRR
jgi:hypothetical protein